jgi:hypothetical protein
VTARPVSVTEVHQGQSIPASSGWTRRRRVSVGSLLAVVVVVGLISPTLVAGWAPVVHWTCTATEVTTTGTFYLPLALVNSPYGGSGFVNSTFPSEAVGFPPSWAESQIEGGGEYNGSVWGSFLWDTANVSTLSNQTTLGPGSNNRCTSHFAISFQMVPPGQGGNGYSGEIFNAPGGPEFGTGSPSDQGEPLMFNFSMSGGNATSVFDNGYSASNSAPVTTCGGPAASLTAGVAGLTTWISFTWNGHNYSVPIALPLSEDFQYHFPANFGTWAVDNLSEPGGPGGGWAFDYVGPCA